ncbi:MAG: hypothetical protein AUH43_10705 [Acidobacteria bacterium 13_1_40CM_65_14]|nr:MAG: hypothetical protein AUH43_10705 [Acidobacteria bacterium 13_1_40CM_65_14]OLC75143.1 MAG: hypothetical protein AUH72_20770 [Acidobacteria bacterium 13_1_40CM_4_65_8]OLE82606.1 MAG: hypothetical protein AUF76_08805 [Acidobacteria bacterium 13_1_20CM_2_65_9]
MKNASKTSNAPSGHDRLREIDRTATIKSGHRKREPQYDDCLAPPKPRRRVREARRWLDELYAATTNGLPRDRWPGQRLFMPSETGEICQTAIAELEQRDPELYIAVRHVIFWSVTKTTVETFKRDAAERGAHLTRIRAEIRRPREFK